MYTRSEIISSGMAAVKKSLFACEFSRHGNRFCQVVVPKEKKKRRKRGDEIRIKRDDEDKERQ